MNIQFDVVSGSGPKKRPESPVRRIIVAGNFSNRVAGTGGDKGSASGNMYNLDPHDIDACIARVAPSVNAGSAEEPINLSFANLDDLRPDALFRQHPAFADMSRLKKALRDPATERQAAVLARSMLGVEVAAPADSTTATKSSSLPADDNTFADLLGRVSGGSTPVRDTLKRILDDAVSQSAVPRTSSDAVSLSRQLDAWCQSAMHELLALPEFRQVETCWQSLQFLVEQLDLDLEVELWIADTGSDPSAAWCKWLAGSVTQTLAGDRPDLLLLLEDFGDSAESLSRLQQVAVAAAELDCPLFASANRSLAGVTVNTSPAQVLDKSDVADTNTEAWIALRNSDLAKYIGLAYPKLMVRQPYGAKSDPVDAFEFEELQSGPAVGDFPWSHGSVLLAVAWLQQEAGQQPALLVSNLPLVTYDDGGGQAIMPATEIYISETATEALLKNGIVPLQSHRGDTSVRLPRLQSIALPPTAL